VRALAAELSRGEASAIILAQELAYKNEKLRIKNLGASPQLECWNNGIME